MTLTPGGGSSPGTRRPPSPDRGNGSDTTPRQKSSRSGGKPRWPRSASVSVLRLGLLIGGLVIIVDLLMMLVIQQTANPNEIAMWAEIDEFANYVLFALLGVLVVRETGVMFAGAVAGVFASLLDAIVVTAASAMVPPPPTLDVLEFGVAKNLVIGTVFAGLSGVVYMLVQRWSDGQRSRR